MKKKKKKKREQVIYFKYKPEYKKPGHI